MPLFRLKGRQVERISPQEHRIREESIHHTIEDNLNKFFGDLLSGRTGQSPCMPP